MKSRWPEVVLSTDEAVAITPGRVAPSRELEL